MEGQAARIARHAVLAAFLCLGLAGLAALALLWSRQPPTTGLAPVDLLWGLGFLLVLGWIGAAWAALRRCSPAGLWVGGALLAAFTALDTGLADCLAGASCAAPPPPLLALHAAFWGLAVLGGVLALRQRRRTLAR